MIHLRGHHLLCVIGFRGHGYSPEFTANMAQIVSAASSNPDTAVCIVPGPDDICAEFPAEEPNHCATDSVIERDRAIVEGLALIEGSAYRWSELQLRIADTFRPAHLNTLCASCSWLPLGYCQQGLAKIRGEQSQR